jgi:hypothetical protein
MRKKQLLILFYLFFTTIGYGQNYIFNDSTIISSLEIKRCSAYIPNIYVSDLKSRSTGFQGSLKYILSSLYNQDSLRFMSNKSSKLNTNYLQYRLLGTWDLQEYVKNVLQCHYNFSIKDSLFKQEVLVLKEGENLKVAKKYDSTGSSFFPEDYNKGDLYCSECSLDLMRKVFEMLSGQLIEIDSSLSIYYDDFKVPQAIIKSGYLSFNKWLVENTGFELKKETRTVKMKYVDFY